MSLCAELVWSVVTLEGKELVPVSDLCTVQTFTFSQGKCIQALEWLDPLPCTALAAMFCFFCGLLLEGVCVPPFLLLKYRSVSGRAALWDGESLFAQGVVEK